jgi:aminodeoxyfutalosine deaminase
MSLTEFIRKMPKVELHVHLEGSVRPATLLKLAEKHNIDLPASDIDGVRAWYTFRDFPHFVEIYVKITQCMQTLDDIELIAREFAQGQAEQNIRYSEVTYTPLTHYVMKGFAFDDQLAALNRARDWAKAELGVDMRYIMDIPRNLANDEQSMLTAQWAVSGKDRGVVALGLGGAEVDNPPENFTAAFQYAWDNGLPSIPHAGETEGAASIWGAIRSLGAVRIGHGVRAIEDPELMAYLKREQIPLEVNPTSNVCLGVVPSIEGHMLPALIDAGLYVTINSDDPPMFNTTLTDEYLQTAEAFGFDVGTVEWLMLNAVRATMLPEPERENMEIAFREDFARLRTEYGL